MKKIGDLPTPAILIDADKMEANLRRMQATCDAAGVELWPHIKTHKMVPVLRRQLELGARGATCAKIGEAEALLASGVRQLFIAHSLVDVRAAPRLRQLRQQLDRLILAVTSPQQCVALEALLAAAELSVPVLMAVDTGLDREGARGVEAASELAELVRSSPRMELIGLYTHEGHTYGASSVAEVYAAVDRVHQALADYRAAVGGDLPLWPGCSVTAALMAHRPGVRAVRPGSYVFGDLFLSEGTGVMAFRDVAASVLATVVDQPRPGLALIDAGSKVFSSDKILTNISARALDPGDVAVTRLSEEHGFLTGLGVDALKPGFRLRFQPAHICPVVNLASHVYLVRGWEVLDVLPIDARGRVD